MIELSRLKKIYPYFLLNYRFWLHVTGWLAFFASPLILPIPFFKQLPTYYVNYLIATRVTINLVLIAIFYLNLLRLTPALLLNKNLLQFIAFLCLLFSLVLLLDSLTFWHIKDTYIYFEEFKNHDPILRGMTGQGFLSTHQLVANGILFSLIILSSSLWAVLADRMRQQLFNQQILFEKTSAELAVLKLQISPHFLFNTLNNIRWLTRIKSDQAEVSVMELSEILRYMLYQVAHDQVDLHDEVTYLKRYINLQKLRIHTGTVVEFVCNGRYDAIKIVPLLLMPFVENAFKFGIHSQHPSFISICLTLKEFELTFDCTNRYFDISNDDSGTGSGLGLQNVQKRLELYYPHNHQLHLDTDGSVFSVKLKINLEHERNTLYGRG